MDEGRVEDVNEEQFQPYVDESSSSSSIYNTLASITGLIESNGWFILIGCILVYYLYNKFKSRFSFGSITQSTHKKVDEEKELNRLRNIEAVRLKQQAALDAAAARYLEEKKKKEEEKAKEKIEEWERHEKGLGYHGKTKKQEDELSALGLSQRTKLTPKPKLRGDDYNPLTGQSNNPDGGSCSYRAGRKGGNKGG